MSSVNLIAINKKALALLKVPKNFLKLKNILMLIIYICFTCILSVTFNKLLVKF